MKISLLLLCSSIISDVYTSSDDDHVASRTYSTGTDADRSRLRTIDLLSQTRTVIEDGYHLESRQVLVDVNKYVNYGTVSVILFNVARDIQDARFTFQAEELQLNNIGSCKPRNVCIQLKYGSYPALNPDGQHFPKDFIGPEFRESIYSIELLSDGSNITYSMKNPKPGNWFALVYNQWLNPDQVAITQQDLGPMCQTVLYGDLQIKEAENINLFDCYSGLEIDYNNIPANFKCLSRNDNEPIELNITISNMPANASRLEFKLNSLSLPTPNKYIISCHYDPSFVDTQTIVFNPSPDTWHYVTLKVMASDVTTMADCESYVSREGLDSVSDYNHTALRLMRDEKGKFFTLDYGLPTTDIHDVTSLLNISCNEIKTVMFEVNPFLDIGGTLTLEVSLLMNIKYYMGYKRKLNKDNLLEFSEKDQFYRVVICVNVGHVSTPLADGECKNNDIVKPALFVLNSTDSYSIHKKVMIPYPESGTWYMTSRLFCDEVVCPCTTSENGTLYYVDPNGTRNQIVNGSNLRAGVNDGNATLVLSAVSRPCVEGKCMNQGNCMLNAVGGLLMSFCQCQDGFAGWDCSDSTHSMLYMLVSVLLLSLSNMAFFLSIYCSMIRLYYTEAVMYTFAMVLSTFYHACDASAPVAYCIIDRKMLQYGDFYCGNLAFWVTLLAMSILSDTFKSTMYLIGAVVISFICVWDMYSVLSYLIPGSFGSLIMLITWITYYKRHGKMAYTREYYFRYLPVGTIFISLGLICFAFLQTQSNYRIIHSLWHVLVALCIAFLLPDAKRGFKKNPFVPNDNYFKETFGKIFNRPQSRT